MDLRERVAEDHRRHPWEVARARFFRRLVAEHIDLAGVRRIVDVGAGDGWFADELAAQLPADSEIVCWDINYRSEDLATPTTRAVVRTAVTPEGPFQVVLALDVLEHVADAEAFLAAQVVPLLDPTGVAVFSVPAHPGLFSDHDRMLEHHRRYRPAELRALLTRHLHVVQSGSLFATLLIPRLLAVGLERLGRHPDPQGVGGWSGGPVVTRALTSVLDGDAALARAAARWGVHLPGLSTWAVAVRQTVMSEPATAIVVPCFNEAERLDATALVDLARLADARVVLVDDGSTDGTPKILTALADEHPATFTLLSSPTNTGKGEAVRRGLQAAVAAGAGVVGYFDADLATPPHEMARLVDDDAPTSRAVRRAGRPRRSARPPRPAFDGPPLQRAPVRHRQQPRPPSRRVRHAVRRQGVP